MNHCSVCAHKHKKDCIWNCGCEAFELDLDDHDKQIRDEVVDEFTEKMEKAIKDEINDEILSMFDGGTVMGAVRFIAEQMKGEQNE